MEEAVAVFPFARIVKQDRMKLALLLNAVDPSIGGALIKGNKGTAKSTAVRSMSQFLPSRTAVKGCTYHCDPKHPRRMCEDCRRRYEAGEKLETEEVPMKVVELPLNATEDRVAGTLDLEHVLETGKRKFEPGILASANGNVLYVDEINLLDDHIIDLLLDSAAMGRNYIEREGISYSHPANFILVGTMNPEEGDLRPQLLDRFGLSVDVENEDMVDQRVEVLKRRLAFDADPEGYLEGCEAETDELRRKIKDARDLLPKITVTDDVLTMAAHISIHFRLEGHRCDLALIRSARANAALNGRTAITKKDMAAVASMVISHRVKKRAFETGGVTEDEILRCL